MKECHRPRMLSCIHIFLISCDLPVVEKENLESTASNLWAGDFTAFNYQHLDHVSPRTSPRKITAPNRYSSCLNHNFHFNHIEYSCFDSPKEKILSTPLGSEECHLLTTAAALISWFVIIPTSQTLYKHIYICIYISYVIYNHNM